MSTLENISANVIALRTKLQLTQEQLADKCKLHVNTIRRIEQRTGSPQWFTVEELAKGLGVDTSELTCLPATPASQN